MPFGKYCYWCPKCGRKGVVHDGTVNKINYYCRVCKCVFSRRDLGVMNRRNKFLL